MMDEHTVYCPLCRAEIPADSESCDLCGALFARGGARGLILKGVVCQHCGERNYSYDFCMACGRPFEIKCPNCGAGMALDQPKCKECGFSPRKIIRPQGTKRMSRLARVAVLLILAAVLISALVYAYRHPVEEETAAFDPTVPRTVDTDADGLIDRWEHFNEQGRIILVETDGNADGRIDRWEHLYPDGKAAKVYVDQDGNGIHELVEYYRPSGAKRLVLRYSNSDGELVLKRSAYRADDRLLEEQTDTDGDGIVNQLVQYNASGGKYIEAVDSSGKGYLDEWTQYNARKQVIERATDADGDRITEHIRGYNAEGKLIWEKFDTDADGRPNKTVKYHHSGRIRFIDYDRDGDGNPEVFESYTKRGVLARTGYDVNGDLKIDRWE